MVEYWCYFFGPSSSLFEGGEAVDTAETFSAESDEHALARAEALALARSGSIHGFELWAGERLVYRSPLMLGGSGMLKPRSPAGEEGSDAGADPAMAK